MKDPKNVKIGDIAIDNNDEEVVVLYVAEITNQEELKKIEDFDKTGWVADMFVYGTDPEEREELLEDHDHLIAVQYPDGTVAVFFYGGDGAYVE